jgi:photosystem II stability/assembly factor-like uncharacterized protein
MTATYSTDDGATLAPNLVSLVDRSYTDDMVLVEPPGTVLAIFGADVYRSTDSGCTWFGIGALDGDAFTMTTVRGSTLAWGRALTLGAVAYRIDGTTVTRLGVDGAVDFIAGMGIHATARDTLRLADRRCDVWESTDGGGSWSRSSSGPTGPFGPALAYDAVFSGDLDHVVCGVSGEGVWHSADGGATWTQATGLITMDGANAFNVELSPVDPSVVWVKALDYDLGGPAQISALYRSTDGGLSFTEVVRRDSTVRFRNSVFIAPHPTDANVVYFPIDDTIHRYDASGAGTLTSATNGVEFVGVLAVLPTTPHVLLIGLERDGDIP